MGIVGLEHFEAAQLQVDHGQRLEALRFEDLLVEPCLDLVLLLDREFLVGIVDVPVKLQQRDLEHAMLDNVYPPLRHHGTHTISSLQMGHTRLDASAALPLGCVPTLMLEPISWVRSARLPLAGGEMEEEATETVLSEGAKGLEDRATGGGVGPRPLPLPRILPPPSLRPDMVVVMGVG
jgi:hypothetical protein